ncbi:hypothetical protein EST38_g5153 [Candolleomyces aberdarensis]|uniref:Uncharacterized protein n=1 Tax=Candolleomyces aberdarensis TaxID=2316362 RepID=A0A4Q2DMV4_9AGAR|nr:hypothetical protein EST38_g5153 [Candolleomyces aberdarensis]
MAARNPIQPQAVQANPLCDYCHLKPKFGGHAFCSKTCGAQAATLCNYCHKKPKFQNFEYCGKNCASLANPGGVPKPAAGPAARGAGGAAPKARGAPGAQQPLGSGPLDPLSIAKIVVQNMPQVQALLNGTGIAANPAGTAQGSGAYGAQVQSQQQPQQPLNNPFLNQAAAAMSNGSSSLPAPPNYSSGVNGYGAAYSGGGVQQQQYQQQQYPQYGQQQQQQYSAEDLECLVPGCGKPVHVDSKGMKTSDYCSQRHREEAVSSGLVQGCIMCLTKPQSHTDYFCSRACREESLSKQQELYASAPAGAMTYGVQPSSNVTNGQYGVGTGDDEDDDDALGLAQN